MVKTRPQPRNLTKIIKLKAAWLILAIITSVIFLLPLKALAIIRGYSTDDSGLKAGMVVMISDSGTADNPKVERATREAANKVVGITTSVNSGLVTIASGQTQVYVETSGDVSGLISDLNGRVGKGDLLTVSPLKGILMKASNGSPAVSIALEDFNDANADTYQYDNGKGGSAATKVALVKVSLDNKLLAEANANQPADSSLARLGKALVGKQVGELRVVIALIIFFLVLITEGGILYGAIASAIISLGRNPLAKNVIKKELFRVMATALVVLVIGLAAIYLILWV